MAEQDDARYYPNSTETEILVRNLRIYFGYPDRSIQRKQICSKTCEELQSVSNGRSACTKSKWTETNTRLWFNNNKKTYLSDNPPFQNDIMNITTAQEPKKQDPISQDSNQSNETEVSQNEISNPFSLPPPSPSPSPEIIYTQPKAPSVRFSEPLSHSSYSEPDSNSQTVFYTPHDNNQSLLSSTPSVSRSSTPLVDDEDSADIPPFPSFDSESLNQKKFILYSYFHSLYHVLKKISNLNPIQRLSKQEELENVFNKTIQQFKELGILLFFCDKSTASVFSKRVTCNQTTDFHDPSQIQRPPSEMTQIITGIKYPNKESDFFYPHTNSQIPSEIRNIFNGQYNPSKFPLEHCIPMAFCFSPTGVVFYCYNSNSSFKLAALCPTANSEYPEESVDTQFLAPPSSMITDGENIWIVGDTRVKGFKASDLSLIETLYIPGDNVQTISCMTFWENDLVVGCGKMIYIYDLKDKKSVSQNLKEEFVRNALCQYNVMSPNKTQGRKPYQTFELEIDNVSSITVSYNYLCVSSKEYPTIHVYNKIRDSNNKVKFEIVGRLIGHTSGVTALSSSGPFSENLCSGSSDSTVRYWDMNTMSSIVAFIMSNNQDITAVSTVDWKSNSLLFVADTGALISGFLLNKQLPLCEIALKKMTAMGLTVLPGQKMIMAICEAIPDPSASNVISLQSYDFNI